LTILDSVKSSLSTSYPAGAEGSDEGYPAIGQQAAPAAGNSTGPSVRP
jgi:hypothetical protein